MARVEFRVIDAIANSSASVVETNSRGIPTLRGMFNISMAACPHALSYTYLNGDIIGTEVFVRNVEAALQFGQDFLMVGQRTNVPWSMNGSYDAAHNDFDFRRHFDSGTLFQPDAEDYFVVTKNAIDWEAIPPFVIGRPGYDNWLVNYAKMWRKGANVTTIDATKTMPMIHQTDDSGDFSWGGANITDSADITYNLDLAKMWGRRGEQFKMPCCYRGKTWHAEWETTLDDRSTQEGGGESDQHQNEKDSIRLLHRHKCSGREHDCDQSYFRVMPPQK